ncbi:MAG: hypothetical protein E7384_08315 [Ruminococcaceae bacterium]|nr:hypothetical protein [Oscillospiraceae bacterium]
MERKILLKTKGETQNQIRYVVTEDGEPVFYGVFDPMDVYGETICSVRIKERLTAHKVVFCDVGRDKPAFINNCNFLPGKMMLVQADSSEHDSKGIKFSTDIKIRGKYLVAVMHQYSSRCGLEAKISKKITDYELKNKLFNFISEYPVRRCIDMDCFCEVICRTSVAELDDLSILDDDLDMIFAEWNALLHDFSENYKTNAKVGIIKGYTDVIDYIRKHERTDDFAEIVSDCPILSHNLSETSPAFADKIKCMSEKNEFDIFTVYAVDNRLCQLMRKQVYLKSGAYLVIEFTEAMTVIDVNSGKNTVGNSLAVNKEAAAEIMRQLRLRDIGGIIVCDFINMFDSRKDRELVLYLKELAGSDTQEIYISNVSHLGLVEIARKRS